LALNTTVTTEIHVSALNFSQAIGTPKGHFCNLWCICTL